MSSQPSFYPEFERAEMTHKAARQVSRTQYAEIVKTLPTRYLLFLDALGAAIEKLGYAPTIAELTTWAYHDGRLTRNDSGIWRPRGTELERLGVVEFLPARPCRVTGKTAHPVKVKSR